MPSTFTASDQLAQPRQCETGINVARGTYTVTGTPGTLSVSDIVFLCKGPHGAWIINGYISGVIDRATYTTKIGVNGNAGRLVDNNRLAAGVGSTLSTTATLQRFNGTLPVQVSLSDLAVPRYAWVTMTINAAASLTACASFTVIVEYCMPGAI